jgi:hypothetical protein
MVPSARLKRTASRLVLRINIKRAATGDAGGCSEDMVNIAGAGSRAQHLDEDKMGRHQKVNPP